MADFSVQMFCRLRVIMTAAASRHYPTVRAVDSRVWNTLERRALQMSLNAVPDLCPSGSLATIERLLIACSQSASDIRLRNCCFMDVLIQPVRPRNVTFVLLVCRKKDYKKCALRRLPPSDIGYVFCVES